MSAHERLSDYLLDELSARERDRFEVELAHDPGLAAEVERLRPVVTSLRRLEPAAWEHADGELPPLALPRASAEPARARRRARPSEQARARWWARPSDRARPRWWARPLVLRPAAAGAFAVVLLALGVVLGGVVLSGDDEGPASGGRVIALAPVEPLGGRATGTATFASSGARVRLTGLPPSANGEFYELWLLNSADDLVALGSFTVAASGEAAISVPVPGDPEDFAAIDVSVEPADGDPAHSTHSVLRAPLAPS